MRLSVVIPTRDRSPSLARVLDALAAQRLDVEGGAEVLVVDDGSVDDTLARLAARAPCGGAEWLRILPQAPLGPAAARNRGAREARGELLLFIGDDTVPESGFLAAHIAAHDSFAAQASLAAPARAVLGYTAFDDERMRVTPFLRYLNEQGPQFGYELIRDPEDVPFAFFYTSNISLPLTAFLALGGFDESFPGAAWEDIEFAYRASRAEGLKIVYRPHARTRHHHPTTLRESLDRQFRTGRAGALLAVKHPELGAWIGTERSERVASTRPPALALAERAIRLADPLGIRLPRRLYHGLLEWHYLTGLRLGLQEQSAANGQPDCITP